MVHLIHLVLGMATGWVWDGPPLSYSCPDYIVISYPHPKPVLGQVDLFPSLLMKGLMIPSLAHPGCAFCQIWSSMLDPSHNPN